MAGYSGTPLLQKLGIKEHMTVACYGAPDSFPRALGSLPAGVHLHHDATPADIYMVFATTREDAERRFSKAIAHVPTYGAIWVAWPKKGSGVETDLTENVIREMFLPTGMVDNKVAAIDDTWSGLRFVVRNENRPSWRQL